MRPACGTCFRRGYVCQGYTNPQLRDPSKEADHEPQSGPSRRRDRDSKKSAHARRLSDARECHSSGSDSDAETTSPALERNKAPKDSVTSPTSSNLERRLSTISRSSFGHSSPYLLCQGLPIIPPGTVQSSDEPGIETYFSRHPSELVISAEFVDEMNSHVLQVFHEDPATVAETLSAIGHIYLGEGGMSIVPVLDRRARILAKLRETTELEQMLVMHLGLTAIEVR